MRYALLGLAVAMVLAGCSDTDFGETTQSTSATITTAAPTTTIVELTDPTTTRPPTTTMAPVPLRSLDDLELEFFEEATGFTQPVLMVTPPDDERLFVVDQPGVVWVLSGADPTVFLDITSDVSFRGEQGLLGLAFHPDFVDNDLFYIYYIDNNGNSVIESVMATGHTADAASRAVIFQLDQPAGNHNGGMIVFGPDENLWIGLGDGGGANDQYGNGQRSDTLLGSMLRITVGPDIDGYTVPSGNLQNEVWAIGLRNPWRFAFDGNNLWIADVGQNLIEEVDVVDWTTGNPNFGWSIVEGSSCFGSDECDTTDFIAPVYEYRHREGCSITGGVVYRGAAMPELSGHFLFADYCTGWLRSVDETGEMREWFPDGTFGGAAGFGIDSNGEPYVLTVDGSLYGLRPAG